jgi:hypothetical protein
MDLAVVFEKRTGGRGTTHPLTEPLLEMPSYIRQQKGAISSVQSCADTWHNRLGEGEGGTECKVGAKRNDTERGLLFTDSKTGKKKNLFHPIPPISSLSD